MSKLLDINNCVNLKEDSCAYDAYVAGNKHSFNYYLLKDNKQTIKDNIFNDRGLYTNTQGIGSSSVDNESELLRGNNGWTMTSNKSRKDKILPTRPYVTMPYMGTGNSIVVDPDKQAQRIIGMDTRVNTECLKECAKKTNKNMTCDNKIGTCNSFDMRTMTCTCTHRSKEINRFEPLVPYIKQYVSDTNNVVEGWQRGGIHTREIVRNADYLKTFNK
jgi:hypothetical protein